MDAVFGSFDLPGLPAVLFCLNMGTPFSYKLLIFRDFHENRSKYRTTGNAAQG
jgi:hypothetical protein